MPDPRPAQLGQRCESEDGIPPPRAVDILLVDDNPAKMLAMETMLAPLGQNLVRAASGREALRRLLSSDFAVIVLDVNMPDMDGFETARMIRARPRSANTPIIFVSAVNTDETDAYRGYGLGAVDYMFAPLVPEVLRAKVGVFVELHRRTEEARRNARRLEQRTRELEASQRDLRVAERMATVGTLCAGLGHDMGNLLLPIAMWMDALPAAQVPPDVAEGLGNIAACVQYLRKLASGLRLVALDPDQEFGEEATRLEEWSGETVAVYRNVLPRTVELDVEVPAGLPAVRISRHRLTQVVFNLVQNAGDALAARSDGVVRIRACLSDEPDSVELSVSDNGHGMTKEVLARCFDPFFSTKSRTLSTGLGLALVNAIIQKTGNHIRANSAPDRGTTFIVTLRASPRNRTERPQALLTLGDPRARGYAAGTLRDAGFRIVGAPDDLDDAPALWIAELNEELEQAAKRFEAGRKDRRVLAVASDGGEAPPQSPRTLPGGLPGLASQLRRLRLDSAQ